MVEEIETGYGIGGRTPVSVLWNSGKLTKDSIRELIGEYKVEETEKDVYKRLLESEAEIAREEFEGDDTISFEEHFEKCVQREMEYELGELHALQDAAGALQLLYDSWTDDVDDEEHYNRVCDAHHAIDRYCRGLEHGWETTPTSIAHRAIQYLRRHGLTITEGWRINGEPPSDVRDYLDGMIAACFPSDEDEVEEQVIALIENELE